MDARAELIEALREAGIGEATLAAIAAVPRERFVPEGLREHADDNAALAIGCGQTISQPLVVARMVDLLALTPTDRVLDVGTGSGYHAAVLARCCAHVWSIERHAPLADGAALALEAAGIDNVTLLVGDGTRGLPAQAPFDAINVAAAGLPDQLADLERQLAIGGRLVAPIGHREQHLTLVTRGADGLWRQRLDEVRFVPLVDG